MPNIDQDRLLVKVGRLYYEEDLTQHEIGHRLRLSRQKVQRLLSQARDEGVVKIVIQPIMGTHDDVEKALEERYGLREAIVVETTAYDNQAIVAREVGAGAAEYVLRTVRTRDKVVLGWGSSIRGMVDALSRSQARDTGSVLIIQGLGAVVDTSRDSHSTDVARRMAQVLDARSLLLPAPGIAGDRETARAFYGDPSVNEVLTAARSADVALLGIGAPWPDSILVSQGSTVSWPELKGLQQRGAVGDINLRCFDEAGRGLASELDDRVIGLTLEEIRRIPHVVGIAGGKVKFGAILGALAGKLIHVLVTDHLTAQKLLEVGPMKPGSTSTGTALES